MGPGSVKADIMGENISEAEALQPSVEEDNAHEPVPQALLFLIAQDLKRELRDALTTLEAQKANCEGLDEELDEVYKEKKDLEHELEECRLDREALINGVHELRRAIKGVEGVEI